MIGRPATCSQRAQISSTGPSKLSAKTTSGSFSIPTSPGYFDAMPVAPSAIGGVGFGSTGSTVDAWRTPEVCWATATAAPARSTATREMRLMGSTLLDVKADPVDPWPSIDLALGQDLPVGLPRVLVGGDGVLLLGGRDEPFLLRPAHVHRLQTPLDAPLRGADRLAADEDEEGI